MSDIVKAVQRALIARGYSCGPAGADGDLGRATMADLARFQAAQKLDIQYPGTIGPTTLAALGLDTPTVDVLPPWVSIAKSKMGLNEIKDNAALKKFLASDGNTLGDPAKLPWCGDLVQTCVAIALPHELMIANPYYALNWLKFGIDVPLDKPVMGAIGVKKRDGGGHVFFIVGQDKTYFFALGGNQSNSISIVKILKSEVIGLRYPRTYPMPANPLGFSVFNGQISASEA